MTPLLLALLSCTPKEADQTSYPPTNSDPSPDTETTADPGTTVDTGSLPDLPCGTLLSAVALEGVDGLGSQVIAVTSDGATYFGGTFLGGPVTLGPGGPNEVTLAPSGLIDGLVVRYEPDGSLGWAVHLATTYWVELRAIAATPDGRVVVVGSFSDTLTLAPGAAEEVTLGAVGEADGFAAAYDAGGTLLWASPVTGSSWEIVSGVGVLADGDVLVVGEYLADAQFGEELLPVPQGANMAGFVARMGPDGGWQWVQRFGGTDFAEPSAAAIDPVTQDLVFSGWITGSGVARFGDPPTIEVVTDQGDAIVARYSADGEVRWVARAPGATAFGVDLAPDGTALVVGSFSTTARFGVGEPNESTLTSSAWTDLWVARYGTDGALDWVRGSRSPPQANSDAIGIAATIDGGAVVTAHFTDTVLLAEGTSAETTFYDASSQPGWGNPLFARYESDGDLRCAVQIEATGHGTGMDAVRVFGGTFLTTGDISGDATFGPGGPVLSTVDDAPDAYLATWAF